MRIRFEAPKENPKISMEVEATEQQIKTGLAKLYQLIKARLPFKIEVGKSGDTR